MPRIGSYELYAIETGRFGLDGGAMFGIIPKPLWSRRLLPDDRNRITLHMRCLLLEGDGRLILIDNGLGDKYDAKFADIFAVDDDHSELHRSLKAAGFEAEDVTDVILTHLHFDHCGGSTRRQGDHLTLTFPKATYHVQRQHWAWAQHPNDRERASFFSENLDPLAASGQLNLLTDDEMLVPGVSVHVLNGHTEAQQLVRIQDAEQTLVFVADLIPTTAHLQGPWIMGYDVRPLVTLREKKALLEEAVTRDWQLFFEHDPDVAVCSLRRTERGIDLHDARPFEALFG